MKARVLFVFGDNLLVLAGKGAVVTKKMLMWHNYLVRMLSAFNFPRVTG